MTDLLRSSSDQDTLPIGNEVVMNEQGLEFSAAYYVHLEALEAAVALVKDAGYRSDRIRIHADGHDGIRVAQYLGGLLIRREIDPLEYDMLMSVYDTEKAKLDGTVTPETELARIAVSKTQHALQGTESDDFVDNVSRAAGAGTRSPYQ